MKFDEILAFIGEFGPYQKRVYILVCLPAIFTAFLTLSSVFTLYIPPHRCTIAAWNNDSFDTSKGLINDYIPMKDGKTDKCTIYSAKGDNSSETDCDAWVYDYSVFTSTIVTDLNLVCERKAFRSHANMLVMVGKLVGSLGQSVISDIFGRKKAYLVFLFLMVTSGFLNYFITNTTALFAIRFISGLSTTSVFIAGFVIGMELVGPSKRMYAGMIIEIFWCLGILLMSGVAYFIRDWQYLVLTLAAPAVLFISYIWFIPESARWLLSKGRKEEAEEVIRHAAKVNKVQLPEHIFDEKSLEEEPKGKLTELFTNRILATRCIIIGYLWAIASLTYYGLTLHVTNLSGNPIANFVYSGLVELLSYVLAMLLLDRLGRKKLLCGFYLLGGIACICTIFPVVYSSNNSDWTIIMLSLVGRLGASGSFAVVYIYTAELYPTPVRNTGVGISSMCSRLGGIIAPYVSDLGVIFEGSLGDALPLVVFGAAAVSAGCLTVCLPETLNKNLPETIEDAKNFSKSPKLSNNNLKNEGLHNEAFTKL